MNNEIYSLDDAIDHIIRVFKQVLNVNSLFVITSMNNGNRITKAFNQHEQLINTMAQSHLLQDYCELVTQHDSPVLVIPNILEDSRTLHLPLTSQLGACSLVGTVLYSSNRQICGVICGLDRKPIQLNNEQLAFMQSLGFMLGYILELENDSVTDSLTGLYNRRYLDYLYHRSSDKLFSVMFIDIDDFKDVNDRYGHEMGDALLIEISNRLKSIVRKTDILIRYGGDEFLICFQHLHDEQAAQFVAEKIRASICEPMIIHNRSIQISASIGISTSNGGNKQLKDMIHDADQAMYGNKNDKSLEDN